MEEYFNSLKELLSQHGSVSVSYVSSKLNLTLEKSKELAQVFVNQNNDYSILYHVQYNLDGNQYRTDLVSSEDLKELSSKHKSLKSSIHAIRNNKHDINTVSKQLFESSFQLSQEEMTKSCQNNTLYIPSFLELKISNIKLRDFGDRPSTTTATSTKQEVPKKEEVKEQKPQPVKSEPKKVEKPSTSSRRDLFDEDDSKDVPEFQEKKRKKEKPKSDTPSKSQSVSKKLKVKEEKEKEKTSDVEMDEPLFDQEMKEEPVKVRKEEPPKTIKFVEKVSKENTYIEKGYYVVEEFEDYVEVVKDNKQTGESRKNYTEGQKLTPSSEKTSVDLNGKKREGEKPSDPKKKLSQASIMSFFKK